MPSSLFGGGARPAAPATASNAAGSLSPQIAQAAQSAKNTMGMLRAAKNPRAAIMQAAQQNPMLGSVMQMCQGRSPQAVFEEQCKQHGLDPNQTMQQIQAMLGG